VGLVILTVTMNAALDRSLTVPNFQVGHRHRASAGFAQAGGKGINVARALKNLDVPVVATGLAGGRTGTRLVEELTTEAILNDFVRIGDESRTSTMVVDPTGGTSTEIYEWGPAVTDDELAMLLEKIAYLARGADLVVLAGSLPRGVDDGFYGEAIRECNRRRVRAVLDTEGAPLRRGVEAEPWLVSPNQREAESLVGQEFHDEEDFLMGLEAIAELGARNVLVGHETGAFLLVREERRVQRFDARIPPLESVTQTSGAGDAMLAGYLAGRSEERSAEEALREAVAIGAAATLAIGGGRFDPREASRLQAAVMISAVEPVVSER
jgi:1-phosphofructokinase/tagatose 6-phosphate kinase